MKRSKALFVALVSVCLMAMLVGVAQADITTTTTFSTATTLPTPSGTFTVAAVAPNFTIANPGYTGTAPQSFVLIPAATVATGGFIATVRFAAAVGGTSGWVGIDNVSPIGVGGVSGAVTIEPTTVSLVSPAGAAATVITRPTATAFGVQLEKKIVAGGAQYIGRIDANNDLDFTDAGETIATSATLSPVDSRSINWVVTATTSVTISSIVIEPPPAPPPPVPVPQVTPSASAPTMGSWGAIVMALVLLAIAGMAIRAKKVSA